MIRRLFVEKKDGYDTVRRRKLAEIENAFSADLEMRMLLRYDIEGLSDSDYEMAKATIFSEPPVDNVYEESVDLSGADVIGVELLPGQYDQRADSAAQCVQLLTRGARPLIKTATIYAFRGADKALVEKLKKYLVNPVESRLCSFEKPDTLDTAYEEAAPVPEVKGFTAMDEDALASYHAHMGFAMSLADLAFVRDYFRGEKREPTETELKVIDTYWSDHCRHTTFGTRLTEIDADTDIPELKSALGEYLSVREDFIKGRADKKYPTLMDMATIGAKVLKKQGKLSDLDESEEINACSIKVKADVGGKQEDWLVMFKNETHNHPTEIEPFGGAATCLGGAIRDPLSGRVYVYQSMRVTGAADINEPLSATLEGKLPQRTISTTAAAGFSSYGNQIGLATGKVCELYDEGYKAKRLETGFVVGAAPAYNVVRSRPEPGDAVLLIGGETGRDGCGGATGSSKAHNVHSLDSCGAEVQKGNPLTERKIQRLFRNPDASRLIKRCNDFGAGGVSVAIGELAPSLEINLDEVSKKYDGLDGTELAISESQERMAVVVSPADAEAFKKFADEENLECKLVAKVTDSGRLVMKWRGKEIVSLTRAFLDTNGTTATATAQVEAPSEKSPLEAASGKANDDELAWLDMLRNLNCASQRGLIERFDSSIGAGTVVHPFGGKNLATPPEAMCAKIPLLKGDTNTGTLFSFGFNPYVSEWSPYHGAQYAMLESVAKIAASGGDVNRIRFTFQEYFEKLRGNPARWGKPLAALLGAFEGQMEMGCASIGGKDSMSGSFNNIDVPPTLVSFAMCPCDVRRVISPEFKKAGSRVAIIEIERNVDLTPNWKDAMKKYAALAEAMKHGKVLSAQSVRFGGVAEAVAKMAFGNGIGFAFDAGYKGDVFKLNYGAILIEMVDGISPTEMFAKQIGETIAEGKIKIGKAAMDLSVLCEAWGQPLENIFPTQAAASQDGKLLKPSFEPKNIAVAPSKVAKPKVFIPVFPGTNCEYDTARAFNAAGAEASTFVFTRTARDLY